MIIVLRFLAVLYLHLTRGSHAPHTCSHAPHTHLTLAHMHLTRGSHLLTRTSHAAHTHLTRGSHAPHTRLTRTSHLLTRTSHLLTCTSHAAHTVLIEISMISNIKNQVEKIELKTSFEICPIWKSTCINQIINNILAALFYSIMQSCSTIEIILIQITTILKQKKNYTCTSCTE